MKIHKLLYVFIFFVFGFIYSCSKQQEEHINMSNVYPWCVVAFDSLERSPAERIIMLKELGFVKYAYDWREKHLDEMESELKLAKENEYATQYATVKSRIRSLYCVN